MRDRDSAPAIDREISDYGWDLSDAAMDCVDLRTSAALMREANELRNAFILANPGVLMPNLGLTPEQAVVKRMPKSPLP